MLAYRHGVFGQLMVTPYKLGGLRAHGGSPKLNRVLASVLPCSSGGRLVKLKD
jgi:hypothetical protein